MDSKRWMIVSHDDKTTNAIQKQLSPGINLTLADDFGKAQEIANKENFDVIITHWMMPEYSGMEKMNEFARVGKDYSNAKAAFQDKINTAMNEFKSRLKQKKPDSTNLLKKFSDKQDAIMTMLSDTVSKLEKEKATFNQEKSQLEKNVAALTQQIEQAEKKASQAVSDVNKLQNELTQSHQENKTLIAQNESLETSLNSTSKDLTQTKNQSDQLLKELTETKNQIADLQSQKDAGDKKFQEEIKTNQQTINDANAQINQLKETVSSLEASLKSSQKKHQDEAIELKTTIINLTKENEDAVKKLTQEKDSAIKKLTQEKDAANKQVTSLEQKSQNLAEQLETVKNDLEQKLTTSQSEAKSLNEQLNQIKQKNQDLETSVAELSNENTLKDKKIAEMSAKLDKHKKDTQTIVNLKSEVRTLQKQTENAVKLVEVAEAEKNALEKKVAEFEEHWNQYISS
ncbi:hypothetical protein MHK_005512 [Candidatus Magnetomorum sp. HK-1]|nr:hypothetical protein MHK_005512 [Candidatus Magnetomorum sp. HK-1]